MTITLAISLLLLLASPCVSDPTVQIEIDGTATSKFINGGPVSVSGTSLSFPPSRFYIGDKDG